MWKTLSIFAALLLAGGGAVSHLKKQDITDARKDLDQARQNKSSLAQDVEDAEATLEKRKSELETAKAETEASETEKTDLEGQAESLKLDLEGKEEEKTNVEAALDDMQEKIAVIGKIEELKTIITQLQAEKRGAEDKVANLKSQLLGAINEKNSTDKVLSALKKKELDIASGRMNGSFSSRVSDVDPSWRYVTINAGDAQGVVKDAILNVVRGGEVIGKVKVTNVEPSRSAADVVPGSFVEGSSLQPGDLLRVSEESKSR